MRKTSEILVSALERLGPNGENWIKGKLSNNNVSQGSKFCMLGALVKDAYVHGELRDSPFIPLSFYQRVLIPFRRLMPPSNSVHFGSENIAQFNDAPETTFQDVKNMFCAAIKVALDQETKE